MIVTVTLNPALDLSLDVPGWQEGEVNRARQVSRVIGGKGINISRILNELRHPTTALTVVGGDSIQQFQRLAQAIGIPIVYINIPGEMRINIHISDPNTGRNLKVNQSGVELDDVHFRHFKLLFNQHLRQAHYVAIGGSLPPGRSPEAYRELVSLATDAGVRTLVDTTEKPLLEAIPEKPFMVKPNRHELEATLGGSFSTPEEILAGARELQGKGAESVVISDGPNPLVALWGNEAWMAVPPEVEVRGPTGAGDSLAAGILASLNSGERFSDALRLGVAASVATCLTPEGELSSRTEILKLLEKVKVERLPVNSRR